MKKELVFLLSGLFLFVLVSCSTSTENELDPGKTLPQKEAAQQAEQFPDTAQNLANRKGVLGVFEVPEMLAMVILDSAKQELVASKRAANYATIEKEMGEIGAVMDGAPGSIYYNNDPKNFKFECVLLIKEMPKQSPRTSKIVVLEASSMLVYNYYGAYTGLHNAYEEMRKYCETNQLKLNGQMREFYLTNPNHSSDPAQWLTRIMVPVINQK